MTEKYLIVWGAERRRHIVLKDMSEAYAYISHFPPSGSTENPNNAQLYELRKKDFNIVLQQKMEQDRLAKEEREKQELRRLMEKYPDEVSGSLVGPERP